MTPPASSVVDDVAVCDLAIAYDCSLLDCAMQDTQAQAQSDELKIEDPARCKPFEIHTPLSTCCQLLQWAVQDTQAQAQLDELIDFHHLKARRGIRHFRVPCSVRCVRDSQTVQSLPSLNDYRA